VENASFVNRRTVPVLAFSATNLTLRTPASAPTVAWELIRGRNPYLTAFHPINNF
jgi:hypothetical protein